MSYGSLSFTSQIQNTLMKILSKTCFVFQYFYVLCYLQDFSFFLLLFVLLLVISLCSFQGAGALLLLTELINQSISINRLPFPGALLTVS